MRVHVKRIFSDNDLEFEEFSSYSLRESLFEEEVDNIAVTSLTLPVTNWGHRTRNGFSRDLISSLKKELEEETLEEVCKQEDNTPITLEFIPSSKINAELSDDPDTIDFIDLLLGDEFLHLLTIQKNLYTAQHMQ